MKIRKTLIAGITAFALGLTVTPAAVATEPANNDTPNVALLAAMAESENTVILTDSEFELVFDSTAEAAKDNEEVIQAELENFLGYIMDIPDSVLNAGEEALAAYIESNPVPQSQILSEWVTESMTLYQKKIAQSSEATGQPNTATLKQNLKSNSHDFHETLGAPNRHVPEPLPDAGSGGVPSTPKPTTPKPNTKWDAKKLQFMLQELWN